MKKIYLTLYVLFAVNAIFSQSNPYREVSIASPTAANLGKYGDVPVSNNTGVPEINIPIYNVKEGPLSLPISLSYHAGGIKLLEPASWVGLGWSLNAGGVITRTVQGAPDERGTSNISTQSYGHFSDYGYTNYLFKDAGGQTITTQNWKDFANGNRDGEPDLFFFNFNGYSGKFYFRDDRTPVIVPQQDLKIDYNYTNGYSIQSFTITTPDGVKYIFGNGGGYTGANPTEITNSWTLSSGLTSGTVISSWYLNKIQSADGNFSIGLKYTQENYGYFTIGTHPIDPNTNDSGYYLAKNILQGVRLNKITFSNGEVDFVANTSRSDLSDNAAAQAETLNSAADPNTAAAKELDQIQIKDNGTFCKQFNFQYDYFNDAVTALPTVFSAQGFNVSSDRKRLKLTSVQETSCDNTLSISPYSFTYSATTLPRRLCYAQDYWGFSNGVTSNLTLNPTYTIYDGTHTNVALGGNRNPAWPAMRGDNLEKITYPTGGSTSFTYEPNDVVAKSLVYGFQSNQVLWVHLPGTESIRTQTIPITISDVSHSIHIYLNNTTAFSAYLTIKNDNTGVTVASYTVANNQVDNEDLTLSATGTYDFTLTVNNDANLTGGCQGIISYNWGNGTNYQNTIVGGLRIKMITENDGVTSKNIVTNYSYYDNGNSSTGVLYDIPMFVEIVRNDLIQKVGYWSASGFVSNPMYTGCITFPAATYYVSPGNLRPMSSVQGWHMGYRKVTVSQNGNGSSIYTYAPSAYSNISQQAQYDQIAVTYADVSSCFSVEPNYPAAPAPYDYRRGELIEEQHFDNNGFEVKDITYNSQYDTAAIAATPVFVVATRVNGATTQYLGTFDSIRTVRTTQVQTTETDYSKDGSSITTQKTKFFGSKYHNAITKEQTTDSKNLDVESRYKYAFDFRVSSCDNNTCGSDYFSACNSCQSTYNADISACHWNGSDQAFSQCLSDAYTKSLNCQNTARMNYVSCQRTNFTNTSNAYQTCHDNAKSAAATDLKPILKMQDLYIDDPIEITTWRNNNLIGAQFNKDTIDASNNAYIKRIQKINLSSPSASFTNALVSGNSISKDSRYLDEDVINFKLGNLKDVTNKSGVINTYIWDYYNNLPVAKILNGNYNQSAYTSFEADEATSNWTYAGTINTGDCPTGTSFYSLQSGQMTFTPTVTLSTSDTFVVSYWTKSTVADIITNSIGPATKGKKITINGTNWTYYEQLITGNGLNPITVIFPTGATNSGIDEVRLYPKHAQMITYTYNPVEGMTSQCDLNNKITYYKYDRLGRLSLISDEDHNILKKYCYNYAGQPSSCSVFYNAPQSKTFVKNNCPGTENIGSAVPYSIDGGVYVSDLSQADADQQATNYINSGGQSNANTVGSCPSYTPFTAYNQDLETGYTVVLTNVYNNGIQYSFSIGAPYPKAWQTLGRVPQGKYNITISKQNGTTNHVFYLYTQTGFLSVNSTSATFTNVSITTTDNNSISIGTDPLP